MTDIKKATQNRVAFLILLINKNDYYIFVR